MNKKVGLFLLIFTFLFAATTYAHSGRTDASGGHNCSDKSVAKGLCTGYHSHNGGGESTSTTSSKPQSNDKDCTDFSTYDEMINYWNSKGYSATYDPENLDGWGNGQVDDGIPCEAPSGYDKTKINNSQEQLQYKKDLADTSDGEKQGQTRGYTDGYQEVAANNVSSSGTDAFKIGYAKGYDTGYKSGKNKITAEKAVANEEGYAQSQSQDVISLPEKYSVHSGLKKYFEEGFTKGLNERIDKKKKEINSIGYSDGKKDINSPPKDVEENYINAYHEGYEKGLAELKVEYVQKGYEAAFFNVTYKKPDLTNDKFIKWYEEGFKSNKEVSGIKEAALSLGKNGEPLKVPSQYSNGKVIFEHYYNEGFAIYEEEKAQNQQTTAGGLGAVTIAWLARRFYVARKMIG